MKMSVLLVASLLSFTAYAADMPLKTLAPLPSPSGSGLYAGAFLGAGMANQAYQFVTLPGTGELHPIGALPGAMVGFGGTMGALYVGIEADALYDLSKAGSTCGGGNTMWCTSRNGFFLSERLVVGAPLSSLTGAIPATARKAFVPPSQWPIPIALPTNLGDVTAIMPFVTGGLYERNVGACISSQGCGQEWMLGYGGGGGIRVPLTAGWNAKAQYDFISFNKNFVPANSAAIFAGTFKQNNEQRFGLGLDYHF